MSEPMDGFSLDAGWLEFMEGELKEQGEELLSGITVASVWVARKLKDESAANEHGPAFLLMSMAHTVTDVALRIAQVESAKDGHLGVELDEVMQVGRSVFSSLLLSGVRFGQRHPDAFGADVSPSTIEELMNVVHEVLKGGEARDDPSKETDE